MIKTIAISAMVATGCWLFWAGLRWCDEDNARQAAAAKDAAWNAPCADKATLLATTAGSPDASACTNKRHRMRVQVASVASKGEAAAVVFCECQR